MIHRVLLLGQIPWQRELAHKLVKADTADGTRVRLVELERGYDEPGWCERPHVVYVLSGSLIMRFDDASLAMQTGDAAVLREGPAHRHRPEPITDRVVLLLVEPDTRVVVTRIGDLSVEGARASDLEEMKALLGQSGLPIVGVSEALDGFVVLRNGGEIVGVCGVEAYGEDGLLRSLAIHDKCRRAGLGQLLVEETRMRARYRGIRNLYLLTETAPEFFARLGFAPVPRDSAPAAIRSSWEFRTGCPITATAMQAPSRA
jgi:amino-acid N-acetyltransferase